ncbi:MAG: recombinase family protein [Oscillospiraceae bacterium]|nr:recombinase family protein [Oscillospiraceae bacterium]
MIRQPEKMTYLYGRLSQEDALQGDSCSIQNQRKILTKYAEDNGFTPYEFIFDDGWSGADFDRPSFTKMIADVEAGRVSTVIVKDMSRFGRDYLRVGFYTEILFSQKDVRLIAINDNVDTANGENDFTPFVNVFNEWFIKNTSQKIRAVWQAKGKSGERLAVIPPYGFCKDPENKNRLEIDEESAAVVRRIFRLSVEGHGPAQIARMLNGERLLNPSAYKYEHGIVSKARPCKDPYFWNTTTVHKILDAPEYIGSTVNFKTYSKSHKDSRPRLNPPEKWMVFEGTHPAIIDRETWGIVRKMRQHKRRSPRHGDPGLFSGAAYCADCGAKLYFCTRTISNKDKTKVRHEGAYSCSTYRKDVQYQEARACSCHYITEAALTELILLELRELLRFVSRHEKRFVRLVMDKSKQEQGKELAAKRRAAERHRRRIDEIDLLAERLYEDNATGKITDERYAKLSAKYEAEQADLVRLLDGLEGEISDAQAQAVNVDRFLALVRRYTEVETLTPAIVHEFIDRIIVHEAENPRGDRRQKVEIIWSNIGAVDLENAQEPTA